MSKSGNISMQRYFISGYITTTDDLKRKIGIPKLLFFSSNTKRGINEVVCLFRAIARSLSNNQNHLINNAP